MPDPLHDERQPLRDEPRGRLQLIQKHKDSNTILAIVMAGIAALFVIAIIAAYNYASNTNVAGTPSTPPAAGIRAPAETIGSGGTEQRPKEVVPDKSQKQQ
jgi:hypothetical protein